MWITRLARTIGSYLATTLLAVVLCAVLGSVRPSTPAGASGQAVAAFPDTPAGARLRWIVEQFSTAAISLDQESIVASFAPEFLAGIPPEALQRLIEDTARDHGPIAVTGFAGRATDTALIALITTWNGGLFATYLNIELSPPHRITSLEFTERPGPPASAVATPGPYTGPSDIGGRTLYLTCAGEGSPTVILESGAGGGASVWTAVQPVLAQHIRVCSYDRANVPGGASDPAPKPRGAADVVADLHALLTTAGVPGPYVLAGHSFGGLYARLFASTYPDDVARLVLIDAAHKDQEARVAELLRPYLPVESPATNRNAPPFVERVGDEQVDFELSADQIRAARATAPLPNVPLTVITHGIAEEDPEAPPELIQAKETLWRELQTDLAALIPGGRLVVAEQSGHGI